MSKYSHFEMCEKIFGDRYKWDEHKQECTLFTRSDMWDKLVEQQQQIAELQKQLKETKADLFLLRNEIDTLKNNLSISQEHKKIIEEQYLEKCKELKYQPAEIVEKIKEQIFNHFNVNNMEEYESLSLPNALFTADAVAEILDTILKEYQK